MPEYSSGLITVPSGATSTGVVVVETARLDVLDGGTAVETYASDGGAVVVSGGGILDVCTVSSGGTVTVLYDGYASDVTVEEEGIYLVSSGGYATKSEVRSGGVMRIYAETRATNVSVLSGGILYVEQDGYARAPSLSQGGRISVLGGLLDSGGIAGTLDVDSGGVVSSSTVLEGGTLLLLGDDSFAMKIGVNSGGTAHISAGGELFMASMFEGASAVVSEGGLCTSVKLDGGRLTVLSGGTAENTTVNTGAGLLVSSGGAATEIKENGGYVEVADGAEVSFVPNAISELTLADISASVHSGTTANRATVNTGGKLEVFSGGTATEVLENGGYVEISDGAAVTFASNTFSGLELADSATVHAGTTATDTTVNSGGKLEVFSGGAVNDITVNPGGAAEVSSGVISGAVINADGSLLIYDGTRITGHMTFKSGAVVIPFVGSILDFDLTQTGASDVALVNDLSILLGTPSYTLTVSDTQAYGAYTLADGAAKFNSTITVRNTLGETLGTLTVGETLNVGGLDYTLNLTDSVLSITVKFPVMPPTNLVGTKDRVSWDPAGTDGYAVEYSKDGFVHCLGVKVSSNALDMLELPAGTYQWRVKATDGEAWAVGDEIVSDNDNTPKVLQSNADGSDDLFFAMPNGTWGSIYYAQHVGSINDWTGTNEIVSAKGKNRLADLFFGSDDANVLCLTDGENGDAIFLDDEFTELPECLEGQQARLAQIDEIRAGAGDDIVDMTSQRFEYIGDGLTIRGGDGNDTIWANKGDNWLFGDAGNDRIVGASGNDVIAGGIGNDRMHGGGAKDTFTFCENWGVDNVEQLADGEVVLWFAEGSLENWDASSLTYTDGTNSVKVSGVTPDQVTLKFGDDGSDEYKALASGMGAFFDATTERIFEESGKGILASM